MFVQSSLHKVESATGAKKRKAAQVIAIWGLGAPWFLVA